MRRWQTFRSAIFALTGSPAVGLDLLVVLFTAEGELVHIGQAAVGPLVEVVDLGEVAGDITTGSRNRNTSEGTATVFVVQDNSLVGGGDALGPPQIERTFGVGIEDAQLLQCRRWAAGLTMMSLPLIGVALAPTSVADDCAWAPDSFECWANETCAFNPVFFDCMMESANDSPSGGLAPVSRRDRRLRQHLPVPRHPLWGDIASYRVTLRRSQGCGQRTLGQRAWLTYRVFEK